MEKKTQREWQRDVLLKLQDAVNSRDEYEWVCHELARLSGAVGATLGGVA